MNIDKDLIYNFKLDVLEYLKKQNRVNFKMSDFFDEEEEVYFFFHNDKTLESNEEFEVFVAEKMDEFFFSNGIFNVCFTDDFIFTDWSNVETGEESIALVELQIKVNSFHDKVNRIKMDILGVEKNSVTNTELDNLKTQADDLLDEMGSCKAELEKLKSNQSKKNFKHIINNEYSRKQFEDYFTFNDCERMVA